MQQRFQEAEKTTTAPSFGNDTVRDVLARAAEIEAQRQEEKLTAVQVEALGQELGMSPDAVRQSLRERTEDTALVTNPVTQEQSWDQQQNTCIKIAAIYSLITFVVVTGVSLINQDTSGLWLPLIVLAMAYIVVALLILPWRHGWKQKDPRQGVMLSCFLLMMHLVAIFAGVAVSSKFIPRAAPLDLRFFLPMGILSVSSGFIGGITGRWWHRRKAAQER